MLGGIERIFWRRVFEEWDVFGREDKVFWVEGIVNIKEVR